MDEEHRPSKEPWLAVSLGFVIAAHAGGCMSIPDPVTDLPTAMAPAIERGATHVAERLRRDVHPVVFLAVWYYRAEGTWPTARSDIELFIADSKAPIDLSRYQSLDFAQTEDGNLRCIFSVDEDDVRSSGTVLLPPGAAEEEAWDPGDFEITYEFRDNREGEKASAEGGGGRVRITSGRISWDAESPEPDRPPAHEPEQAK
jgi:hypothetical protein